MFTYAFLNEFVSDVDGRLPPGQGKALVSFRVNKSPDLGTARITPDHGVELDTNFKVFFSQWKDPEGVSTVCVCVCLCVSVCVHASVYSGDTFGRG